MAELELFRGAPRTPLRLPRIQMVDKEGWILGKVAGKSVLHLGPTDSPGSVLSARQGRLLHQKLQGRCRELVGLDLDRQGIEDLSKHCQINDIIWGNAEALDQVFPERKFELILAGDIIEHVNNLGNLLASAKKVLSPGGELLITTPNALAVKRVLGAIFLRQERNHPDHMYFFSPMNLWQAARRFGYEITEIKTFMFEAYDCKLNARGNAAARLIMKLTGNYFLADELAVVFVPVTETVQPRST